MPLATNAELRQFILDVRRSYEQTIDETSKDVLIDAGYSAAARARARALVSSFSHFIDEHQNDIKALQVLYSRPYRDRLTYRDIKELANALSRPPHA